MSETFIDPVVAEIHAVRAAMLELVGGDIATLMRQVADRQEQSGREIIRTPLQQHSGPLDAPQWPMTAPGEQSHGSSGV
jgi:hypothetical protein